MKSFLYFFIFFLFSCLPIFSADMRFVQVSDVCFSANNENEIFSKMIKDINGQKDVEFVVFTGDSINKPSKTDLEAFLEEAKKLNTPFYIVIGDKDVNKLKDMGKNEFMQILRKEIKKYKPEKPNFIFVHKGVTFMLVDGAKDVITGTNGFFKEETICWLEEQLNLYPNNNTIIFQHFPLIPPSNREMYYTFKPEKYLDILKEHKNVKAVVSGHFGVNLEKNIDGIKHISTSGLPYYRIIDILDCDTPNPMIWAELKEIK